MKYCMDLQIELTDGGVYDTLGNAYIRNEIRKPGHFRSKLNKKIFIECWIDRFTDFRLHVHDSLNILLRY